MIPNDEWSALWSAGAPVGEGLVGKFVQSAFTAGAVLTWMDRLEEFPGLGFMRATPDAEHGDWIVEECDGENDLYIHLSSNALAGLFIRDMATLCVTEVAHV